MIRKFQNTEPGDPDRLLGDPRYCIPATVSIIIYAPRAEVFRWFVELDLSRVLQGYGPLPAVIRTFDQSGPWDRAGQRRTLHMSRRIYALQEIMVSDPPEYFAYRVTGFTHFLSRLVNGAEARWWFEERGGTATELRWTYAFWARSNVAKLAVYPIVKLFWIRYMRKTIYYMRILAEQDAG